MTSIPFLNLTPWTHDCSGCFRLERLPGGTCTHWKAPPYHGRDAFIILSPYGIEAGCGLHHRFAAVLWLLARVTKADHQAGTCEGAVEGGVFSIMP